MNLLAGTRDEPQHAQDATRRARRWSSVPPCVADLDVLDVPVREDWLVVDEGPPRLAATLRRLVVSARDGGTSRFDALVEPWLFPSSDVMVLAAGLITPREVLVNRNVALGYHVDRSASYRAMNVLVVLRHACRGGLLAFPERGVAVDVPDGWVAMFDGQREVHGTTPLIRGEHGERASVVFYCVENEEAA